MEKIKIFDLHSDILYDVYQASLKGDLERFENYHLPKLKNNTVAVFDFIRLLF